MGGLFDDIFDDDDFEIKDEEELELDDDWNPRQDKGKTWDTGVKPDIWNADEPWTCDDDCDPKSDCNDCQKPFEMDDFFN